MPQELEEQEPQEDAVPLMGAVTPSALLEKETNRERSRLARR